MKSAGFVSALNGYAPSSLVYVAWALDTGNQNGGYPAVSSVGVIKNSECKMTSFKVGSAILTIDQKNRTASLLVPYTDDITAIAPEIVTSYRSTISPASGEAVDFSRGPVSYTVTAENGETAVYTVSIIRADPSGLGAMSLTSGSWTEIFKYTSFIQDTFTYDLDIMDKDMTAAETNAYFRFKLMAAQEGAAVTASSNGGEAVALTPQGMDSYVSEKIFYNETIRYGLNTLTITVTPPEGSEVGEPVTYTFNINVRPTLDALTLTANGTSLALGHYFTSEINDYGATVPAGTAGIVPAWSARTLFSLAAPTVTVEPAQGEDGSVDVAAADKLVIRLADAEGTVLNAYTIALVRPGGYVAVFDVTPASAFVTVFDGEGKQISPVDGAYHLTDGVSYTYTVAASGYKTASGTIASSADLAGGRVTIVLERASAVDCPIYDAYWPSFRGNAENMAISSVAAPNSAELLWTSRRGKGYASGAVGSPILVGGYLYTYAGESIMKIDPADGSVLPMGKMVGASDFAIVSAT